MPMYSKEFLRAAIDVQHAAQKLIEATDGLMSDASCVVTIGGVVVRIETVGAPPGTRHPAVEIPITDAVRDYVFSEPVLTEIPMRWEARQIQPRSWECARLEGGMKVIIGNAFTRDSARLIIDNDRIVQLRRPGAKESNSVTITYHVSGDKADPRHIEPGCR